MRNSLKVARWEIKRNMKNKSFLISLFLTPLLFILFATVPTLLEGFSSDTTTNPVKVYVHDEVNIWQKLEETIKEGHLDWDIELTELDEAGILPELNQAENTVYIPLTETALEQGSVQVFQSKEMNEAFIYEVRLLEQPLRELQLQRFGLSAEQIELLAQGVEFKAVSVAEPSEAGAASEQKNGEDSLTRIVPGAFAGVILFSIVITGMMIFQSASQEKKEKVAEIILSSLSPTELMQGKIIGYFGLGITQVLVWLSFAIPIVMWKFDVPVMQYLFVPELALLLFIAIAGYLLFAAIFVGIGATIEDMTTAGNFQGLVFMLPWLPFILIGPISSNPSGIIAQIGSYIPFTAPGVLLIRLSLLDEWPWVEIIISLLVLTISIWLFMKLAGKIFKTGILMYGKNATPQEIWKWLRH